VGTCPRAKAAAPAGEPTPSTPAVADVSTQMELLKGQAAAQTSDCRKHQDLSPGAGAGSRPACKRYAQVEDLLHQVPELLEAVRRLQNIREAGKEIRQLVPSTVCSGLAAHGQTAKNSSTGTHRREGGSAEEWKLASARTIRRKTLPPKPEMPLPNHFTVLQAEDGRPTTSGETLETTEAARSAPRVATRATKKRQRVTAAVDSPMRGVEAPICQLTHSLERCAAYQGLVSGTSPRDY